MSAGDLDERGSDALVRLAAQGRDPVFRDDDIPEMARNRRAAVARHHVRAKLAPLAVRAPDRQD